MQPAETKEVLLITIGNNFCFNASSTVKKMTDTVKSCIG